MNFRKLLFFFFLISSGSVFSQAPSIAIQPFAGGFSSPVDVRNCGDSRIFVVEQDGYIRIITDSGNVLPTPFLNIDPIVQSGGEQGLLGLAFHPDYKNNGYFYVYYNNNSGNLAISRFNVSAADSNVADPNSLLNLMTIPHPTNSNHNGGCIRFGADGYLYFGTGDGGGGGDTQNNAQNPAKYLGKMIRIDVDGGTPYAIPPDNPYINSIGYFPEIFAVGLRNPWRFSFDRLNGDMWIGDVGQGAWEEVDYIKGSVPAQYNFGWRCYEGNHAYNTAGCQSQSSYDPAIYEMPHAPSGYCSVVGGYVYRGAKYGDMFGCYFFGDYCNDTIHVIRKTGPTTFQHYGTIPFAAALGAFGEDAEGNIYVTNLNNGDVRKIVSTNCAPTAFVAEEDTVRICADSVLLETPFSNAQVYSWITPTGSSSSNQVWVSQSGWVKVTVVNLSACIATDSAYIEILGQPAQPVISGVQPSYCYSSSVVDTLVATPAGGTFSGTGVTGNLFTPSTAAIGQIAITYQYTDSNLCSASGSINVDVIAAQTGSIQGIDSIYCSNFGIVDTLVGIPAGGTFSGTGISGNVFDPSIAVQGQFAVVYQYVDSNLCSGSVTDSVIVEVCFSIAENTDLGVEINSLYQTADGLELNLKSTLSQKTIVSLHDATGRLLYNETHQINSGNQKLSIPFRSKSGIYFISLRNSKAVLTLRYAIMK